MSAGTAKKHGQGSARSIMMASQLEVLQKEACITLKSLSVYFHQGYASSPDLDRTQCDTKSKEFFLVSWSKQVAQDTTCLLSPFVRQWYLSHAISQGWPSWHLTSAALPWRTRKSVRFEFRWLQYDTNVTALPLGFLTLQQRCGKQLERGTRRASPGAAPGHQPGWTAGHSPATGTETKIPEDITAAFLLLPGEDYSPLLCRQALHSILLTELVNIPVLRMLFVHLFQMRPSSLLYHLSTQLKARATSIYTNWFATRHNE